MAQLIDIDALLRGEFTHCIEQQNSEPVNDFLKVKFLFYVDHGLVHELVVLFVLESVSQHLPKGYLSDGLRFFEA